MNSFLGRSFVVLAFTSLLAGCTNLHPRRLLDLNEPVYAWHSETASCGSLRVVDGGRRSWSERGCEGTTTGFVQGPTVSQREFDAIAKAFAGLPHEIPTCPIGTPAVHIFTSREGSVQKTWRVCIADTTAPTPPVFAEVEAAFGKLRAAP